MSCIASAQGGSTKHARPSNPRVAALRALLERPMILKGPCCHDALSAKLIEEAGALDREMGKPDHFSSFPLLLGNNRSISPMYPLDTRL